MSRFVEEHRGRFGVEPICRTVGVSASAYYRRKTGRRSRRSVQDERLLRPKFEHLPPVFGRGLQGAQEIRKGGVGQQALL